MFYAKMFVIGTIAICIVGSAMNLLTFIETHDTLHGFGFLVCFCCIGVNYTTLKNIWQQEAIARGKKNNDTRI
jgi:hypothetical protein